MARVILTYSRGWHSLAICFAVNAELTRDNVGWVIGLPMRLAELIFGDSRQLDKGT